METTQQFIQFFPLEEGHQPNDISRQIMTLRLSKHRFLSWGSMFQRRRRYFRAILVEALRCIVRPKIERRVAALSTRSLQKQLCRVLRKFSAPQSSPQSGVRASTIGSTGQPIDHKAGPQSL